MKSRIIIIKGIEYRIGNGGCLPIGPAKAKAKANHIPAEARSNASPNVARNM